MKPDRVPHERGIADQRGDLDCFAGAIDAALSVDEGVRGLRRLASANVALGKIDRRAVEVEDREVSVWRVGHQHAWADIAFAAHDGAGEVDAAGAIRIAARQHFVVARHEFQFHACNRLGRLQRPDRRGHAVIAGVGREREVGDDRVVRVVGIELAVGAPEDALVLPGLAERLVKPLIDRTERLVAEGIIGDAELADAGVIFGTGFAPFTGGPLNYRKSV